MVTLRQFAVACGFAVLTGGAIAAASGTSPLTFASPQAGFDSFVAAVRAGDTKTLKAILGPEGDTIVESGDPVADKTAGAIFLAGYDIHSKLDLTDPKEAVLEIGTDDWPLPIPMVKTAKGWQFDAAAGKEEILARRIGRNELETVQACLAYVDAQRDYSSADRGDGVLDYAQRFISSPKKHDGLYWPAAAGEPTSPLGPDFVVARARGYKLANAPASPAPFHGYYFRILTGQGSSAPGGAYSYLAGNRMIGGFALVAYPARYGVSGVMSFTVNQDGVVYQKDLGARTAAVAEKMTAFDPGNGWTKSDGQS
jgi:hypothetical protein